MRRRLLIPCVALALASVPSLPAAAQPSGDTAMSTLTIGGLVSVVATALLAAYGYRRNRNR